MDTTAEEFAAELSEEERRDVTARLERIEHYLFGDGAFYHYGVQVVRRAAKDEVQHYCERIDKKFEVFIAGARKRVKTAKIQDQVDKLRADNATLLRRFDSLLAVLKNYKKQ